MKIACFYPKSQFASWSMTLGWTTTLRRMGHEVIPAELPGAGGDIPKSLFESIKAKLPTLEALKECNAILVSGPEHIAPWLDTVYGKYEWKHLEVPKAAWLHETMQREDYSIDWDGISLWADEHFLPAYQDADWLAQPSLGGEHVHWLPFGVDTEVFQPCKVEAVARHRHINATDLEIGVKSGQCDDPNCFLRKQTKAWPIAFIGLMYDKRAHFLNALGRHNHPPLRVGTVGIQDLEGYRAEESARRMASNIRQIGVFFNLPAMSSLLVSKVYEVMACGTFLLTPQLNADHGTDKNMEPFESGRHLVYYRSSNLPYVAQLLRDWSSPEKEAEREQIAAEGCREVHENHSLEKRLAVILEKIGVKETVQ